MTAEETLKQLDENYKLIPFSEIEDVARALAVRWIEGYEPRGFDIEGKHKLASDFMNYAHNSVEQFKKELREIVERRRYDMHKILPNSNRRYFTVDEVLSLLES